MADVHLPSTLTPLFAGLPRQVEVEAATVDDAIDQLDERWPGVRDRLVRAGPVAALATSTSTWTRSARRSTRRSRTRSRVDVIAAISGG